MPTLEGLQLAKELHTLYIENSTTSTLLDLSLASELNILNRLTIKNSKVSNFGSLANSPSITYLSTDGVMITDEVLQQISEIQTLIEITFVGNSTVTTLAPLEKLKNVHVIYVDDWTEITDVDSIYALSEHLHRREASLVYNSKYITDNPVDVEVIPAFESSFCKVNSYTITTSESEIEAIGPFHNYMAHACFDGYYVQYEDKIAMYEKQMESLTYVNIKDYVQILDDRNNVDNANEQHSYLYDLNILSYAKNLETLVIDNSGVVDISFVGEVLKSNDFYHQDAGTPELKVLSANNTKIYDFSPLFYTKKLEKLNLSNANIDNRDLEIISQVSSITTLNLDNNSDITNINVLYNLPNLETISLKNTGVSASDIKTLENFINGVDMVDISSDSVGPINDYSSMENDENVVIVGVEEVEERELVKTGNRDYFDLLWCFYLL